MNKLELTEKVGNFHENLKLSSLSNFAYQVGDSLFTYQPAGLLGSYIISTTKILRNFNPLAATAAYAIQPAMISTIMRILAHLNLNQKFSFFIYPLTQLGMAGIYLSISILTIKEQLAVNGLIFTAAIFAKIFGKPSENLGKASEDFHDVLNKNPIFIISSNILGAQISALLSTWILSAIKISKNFSPLAATGSSAVYDFTETLISQIPRKIAICSKTLHLGLIINVGAKPLAIIAAAGFYASVSILTFKGQLLVNAVILAGAMTGFVKSTKIYRT